MHEGFPLLPSGFVLFTPPVELDLATAPDAVTALHALADQHACIAVELSSVEFIDSSGLSALIAGRRRAVELGGDLVLVGATPRTLRLLELTELDQVFRLYKSSSDIPAWPADRPSEEEHPS